MPYYLLKTLKFAFLLIVLKSTEICSGQQNTGNETIRNNLIKIACNKVDSLFGTDFLLKNGRIYQFEFFRAKGHPYFNTNQWMDGRMEIGEKIYPNIPLLFDIYNDKVICKIKGKNNEEIIIETNNLNVKVFDIGGHQFINCNLLPNIPQRGFYEIIYKSDLMQVYSKWTKVYLDLTTNEYSGLFDKQKQVFFILKNGRFNRIDSDKDLYKLFNADKNKIKSFRKKNKLKLFKPDNKDLKSFFQFLENLN
jgi:hypothetical protein